MSILWPKGNPLRFGLQKICLSGGGKGRITSGSERLNFSYESILFTESKRWKMGVSIPFHKDEVIDFNFQNIDNKRISVKGDLYARIKSQLEVSQNKSSLRDYNHYLKWISYVLDLIVSSYEPQKSPYNCGYNSKEIDGVISGICARNGDEIFAWFLEQDHLLIRQLQDQDISFQLKAYDLNEKFFERLEISLWKNNKKIIDFELLTKSCF